MADIFFSLITVFYVSGARRAPTLLTENQQKRKGREERKQDETDYAINLADPQMFSLPKINNMVYLYYKEVFFLFVLFFF